MTKLLWILAILVLDLQLAIFIGFLLKKGIQRPWWLGRKNVEHANSETEPVRLVHR